MVQLPPTDKPAQPLRRDLKATMFWCARWLLGGDHFHRGPLAIRIGEGRRKGESLELVPSNGDEVYPPDGGPIGSDHAGQSARLLAAFLSSDCRVLMKVIADRGPVAAKVAVERSGLERSRAYVLLGELTDRGLIMHGKGGYEVVPDLWAVLGC